MRDGEADGRSAERGENVEGWANLGSLATNAT